MLKKMMILKILKCIRFIKISMILEMSYVCTYVCMHICMHVCIYVCMYVCMHVFMYAYVCFWFFGKNKIKTCTICKAQASTQKKRHRRRAARVSSKVIPAAHPHSPRGASFLYMCMYVCVCVCVCVFVCVCVCVCSRKMPNLCWALLCSRTASGCTNLLCGRLSCVGALLPKILKKVSALKKKVWKTEKLN